MKTARRRCSFLAADDADRRDDLRYNYKNYNAVNAVVQLRINTEKYNNNRYDVGQYKQK